MDQLKDCHLDHIAIAVTDLEQTVATYQAMGLKFDSEREQVETEGVRVAFAPVDSKASIELLQATTDESAIAKFIAKKGAGIHHICFMVPDITAKSEELKSQGFKLIYDSPKPGARNTLVNFVHPKSASGVLIELAQKLTD